MPLCCPKCASDNVQSIALVLQAGTQDIQLRSQSAGIGVGAGGALGLGAASTSTSGVARTALAQALAKPAPPNGAVLGVIALVALAALASPGYRVPGLIGGVAAAVGYYRLVFRPAFLRYQARLQAWQRLHDHGFLCLRCGERFVPAP